MSEPTNRRRQLISTFLAEHGFADASISPLAQDASFRSYRRIGRPNGNTAILMDAPPEKEAVEPFIQIGYHLRSLGFSAPEVFASDPAAGLVLLEDFGDDKFSKLLARGENEYNLYSLAVDVLANLHQIPNDVVLFSGLSPYSINLLIDEVLLLPDWLVLENAKPLSPSGRDEYIAIWTQVLDEVTLGPKTLTLRDFHVDNLMCLRGRQGISKCGLLDFQDAVSGPPAYDLMSLLEDARRDISPSLKSAMLLRYQNAMGMELTTEFERTFTILAAQRHAKVIGIFSRLFRRDSKPAYLQHLPRVWNMLEKALLHPALAPIANWFEYHVPNTVRDNPRPKVNNKVAISE